jgi:hypothetical protein
VLMPFMTPGLVQLHALQHLEQILQVQRETPQTPPSRRLRKALGGIVGYGRLLLAGLGHHGSEPDRHVPALHGCG